jgi:hypothetical protein
MPLTTVNPALLDTQAQYTGFKNRIINGAMVIDQRNAGAAVTVTIGAYSVDRWLPQENNGSTVTAQQSTTVPSGFTNSLLLTASTGATSASGEVARLQQRIEGFNWSDLGYGAAGAKTVTVSFWVRSSVTGTYCFGFMNSAQNRAYASEYSISVADTWEYKTITIAGDTSGTWLTTNGIGILCLWDLGSGSDFNQSAGSWSGTNDWKTSNQVDWVGTTGATFYITGVQLEVGSTATSFDYRPYGTELALCQRYFEKSVSIDTAILTNTVATFYGNMQSSIANGIWYLTIPFKVTKRAAPTVTTYPYTTASNTGRFSNNVGTDYGASSAAAGGIYDSQFSVQNNSGGTLSVGSGIVFGSWFASSEL